MPESNNAVFRFQHIKRHLVVEAEWVCHAMHNLMVLTWPTTRSLIKSDLSFLLVDGLSPDVPGSLLPLCSSLLPSTLVSFGYKANFTSLNVCHLFSILLLKEYPNIQSNISFIYFQCSILEQDLTQIHYQYPSDLEDLNQSSCFQ